MLVRGARRLPGLAIVVIPLGLAILGIECAWVRRRLKRVGELGRAWESASRRLSTTKIRRNRVSELPRNKPQSLESY